MAEQVLSDQWTALADTEEQTYSLQNLSRYRVHFVTGAERPSEGTFGKVLFPFGHYLSVGAATPDGGEMIWVRSEGSEPYGKIEYS